MQVSWSQTAYLKLVFHCCKYLSSSVSGILLGHESNDKLIVEECIPISHSPLMGTTAELALLHIDHLATQMELKIIGIYHANALTNQKSISEHGIDSGIQRIATKIRQHFSNGFIFLVDSSNITSSQSQHPAGKIFPAMDPSGTWAKVDQSIQDSNDSFAKSLAHHFETQTYKNLVDFDQYLDDQTLDYTNSSLLGNAKSKTD